MKNCFVKPARELLLCAGLTWITLAPVAWSRELPTAKPEDVGMSAAQLARIGPAVAALMEKNQLAGAITMVARHGKVVYFEAFGKSDVASGQPMQRDAIMRFYSMTKPITSVAAMLLVEEGKVGLDEPLAKYLPEFKGVQVLVKTDSEGFVTEPAKQAPTVRDLLRHTAGLTYGFLGNTPVDQAYNKAGVLSADNTLADLTRKVSALPLLYQPGTKWNYSVSADVLARLVEVVSGKSFDAFLTERIFQPLDLHDTGFYVPGDKQARLAAVHTVERGQLKVLAQPLTTNYFQPPKLLSGGGGLVSTARDYMRFCQMLSGGGQLNGQRLLRPETVQAMTTNQLPPSAMPISFGIIPMLGAGFGLGFSVQVESSWPSAAQVGEYGWSGLASTSFWISPKDDLVVILLQQYLPYSIQLDQTIKPIVYHAITE